MGLNVTFLEHGGYRREEIRRRGDRELALIEFLHYSAKQTTERERGSKGSSPRRGIKILFSFHLLLLSISTHYSFTNPFGRKWKLFLATLSPLFMELYTKKSLHEDSLAAAWSKRSFQDCQGGEDSGSKGDRKSKCIWRECLVHWWFLVRFVDRKSKCIIN